MAAEYSANAAQNLAANASVIFTETPVPCRRGLVFHRDESGIFRLASPSLIAGNRNVGGCCCAGMPMANYLVTFGGNVAIPTGGTVEEISMALFVDGAEDPSSTMLYTPAAVEQFGNISRSIIVQVPWICRCSSFSVRNTSTQAITLQNANLVVDYLGITR